jgi:anti-sigma factor RsiW
MTGNLISWPRDRHAETIRLLPWYVLGQLDANDLQTVEAHLSDCEACRAELNLERGLVDALKRDPMSADEGWSRIQQQLRVGSAGARDGRPQPAPPLYAASGARRPARSLGWPGWVIGAQAAAILVLAVMVQPAPPDRLYRVLGAEGRETADTILVMFRPDTSEAVLRAALAAGGARFVDGPTDANAYVIAVPEDTRPSQVARLRQHPHVLLAEPVTQGDGG